MLRGINKILIFLVVKSLSRAVVYIKRNDSVSSYFAALLIFLQMILQIPVFILRQTEYWWFWNDMLSDSFFVLISYCFYSKYLDTLPPLWCASNQTHNMFHGEIRKICEYHCSAETTIIVHPRKIQFSMCSHVVWTVLAIYLNPCHAQ